VAGGLTHARRRLMDCHTTGDGIATRTSTMKPLMMAVAPLHKQGASTAGGTGHNIGEEARKVYSSRGALATISKAPSCYGWLTRPRTGEVDWAGESQQ
jgi:hypothetical protein